MPSILFVCTANRFRSPLAAGFLRKNLEEQGISDLWNISSAGTWATPGSPVIPGLIETALKFGIDLSHHRSQPVTYPLLLEYDLVIVMQAGHKEALLAEYRRLQDRVFLLSEAVEHRFYDIPDAHRTERGIREVALELDSLIRRGTQSLCSLATDLNKSSHIVPN